MAAIRKTKIVATLGPATDSLEEIKQLLLAGVDVCRVNCSHCDAAQIRRLISTIRRASSELQQSTAILLDLQGPKIRCGQINPPVELADESILTVVCDTEWNMMSLNPAN